MFGDARRAVVVGGAVLFGVGLFVGYLVFGGDGDGGGLSALDSPTPSASASPTSGGTAPAPTPSPGQEPAITTQGQVLVEGDRPVVAAAQAAPCQSLVTAGTLGECGEVPIAAGRVVWVIERSTAAAGATTHRARVFTFVADAGGWVEWLEASDPTGERWSDVNVLPTDLTGDGVAEIVMGFRGLGDDQALEYDIVGYSEDGLPAVLAHRDPATRGIVIIAGGVVQEYEALYPNDEPACCPPSYLRRTIGFDEGFFRVLGSDTVAANAVPASTL